MKRVSSSVGVIKYSSAAMKRKLLAGEEPEWMRNHIRRDYIRLSTLSYPYWVDRRDLRLLTAWVNAMSVFTGERYVVDHVIPINHPYVCGLSVPWNMRVVPWRVNASKGNQWHPDQLTLPLDKEFATSDNRGNAISSTLKGGAIDEDGNKDATGGHAPRCRENQASAHRRGNPGTAASREQGRQHPDADDFEIDFTRRPRRRQVDGAAGRVGPGVAQAHEDVPAPIPV